MSTATKVPETHGLSGEDAWRTLRRVGPWPVLRDAAIRFRYADGFSHARSMAFLTLLVMLQGIIAVVGLAAVLDTNQLSRGIVTAIHDLAPGPSGRVLTSAVRQAREAGTSGDTLAVVLGLFGAIVSGTTAMGQLERGLNRIYGVERDRPTLAKYGRALGLALTAGVLFTCAFLAVGFGPSIGRAFSNDTADDIWAWARWPLALLLMSSGVALLFRWCPRRHQPAWSWLAFGSSISVVLWFVITVLLSAVFQASTSFGDTYGPLAGVVALAVWAVLTAIGLLYGGAVAAQLEAVRAGLPTPATPTHPGEEPVATERRPVLVS